MAARVQKIRHDENTRLKIQADRIIERLRCFFLGVPDRTGQVPDLSPAQVTVGLGLLKKSLPDLQAVEHSGELTTHYVARLPAKTATMPAWQDQHAPKPGQSLQ